MKAELKPFIKWVGGKSKLLSELEARLPLNIKELEYFEPFIGGGAMFLYMQPKIAVISDSNEELINTWNIVKKFPDEIIYILNTLKSNKEEYYNIRNIDREDNWKIKYGNEYRAARFIYLNKLCFNGIWRENKNGCMNVSYNGNTKDISKLVNYTNLLNISEYLNCNDVSIYGVTYDTLVQSFITDIDNNVVNLSNTFWYLDPPYADLDTRKVFTGYNANVESNDIFHEKLKNYFTILSNSGAYVMESNSNSQYIYDLYKDYNIDSVYVNNTIGGIGSERGTIKEVIIKNY